MTMRSIFLSSFFSLRPDRTSMPGGPREGEVHTSVSRDPLHTVLEKNSCQRSPLCWLRAREEDNDARARAFLFLPSLFRAADSDRGSFCPLCHEQVIWIWSYALTSKLLLFFMFFLRSPPLGRPLGRKNKSCLALTPRGRGPWPTSHKLFFLE